MIVDFDPVAISIFGWGNTLVWFDVRFSFFKRIFTSSFTNKTTLQRLELRTD